MKRHSRFVHGGAAVEFLFCLPLLLLLAFPVVDLARVLQADIILVNMSREGANLASRTQLDPQSVMASLAATAPPLNMRQNGSIRITKILGTKSGGGVLRNVVVEQHQWLNGATTPNKGVWSCGAAGTAWRSDGSCGGLPAPALAPDVNLLRGKLAEGDMVYLVETFYQFPLLFGVMNFGANITTPDINPELYAMTVF